jgi:hypothetical protein
MLLLLSEREQITRRFSDHVHRDMLDVEVALKGNAEIGASAKKAVQQAVDTQANATSQAVRKEIIDSGGLEHSPYAYIVASADKLHWAPRYNDTVARGMFGNTDIAIKAIGPVNFTIKGLVSTRPMWRPWPPKSRPRRCCWPRRSPAFPSP